MRFYTYADEARVDTDEGRFRIVIETQDGDHMEFDIHAIALEFYENVQAELGGWAREGIEIREQVRRGVPQPVTTPIADVEDAIDAGYALDDPKSPGYHDRIVGDA